MSERTKNEQSMKVSTNESTLAGNGACGRSENAVKPQSFKDFRRVGGEVTQRIANPCNPARDNSHLAHIRCADIPGTKGESRKLPIGTVLSLFDYSGNAVRDWAAAGYDCHCLDICHASEPRTDHVGAGSITYHHADLNHDAPGWSLAWRLAKAATGHKVLFAWPPCEDMAVSGNRHKAGKAAADPRYQWRAMRRATRSAALARKFGFVWMVENPVGALSTLWRKPDYIWHPYQFGGYLPQDDVHPSWPDYIAPRDAYTKQTGAWIGGGFRMPERREVPPEIIRRATKSGRILTGSRQFFMLGGKSAKTKAIRNLGP